MMRIQLVHDFGCVRSADIYNDLLKKQVHFFKETEGGRTEMCEIVEKAAEQIAERKAKEKVLEAKLEDIKVVMEKLNGTVENAMEFLDMPQEQWDKYKSLM